MKISVIGAGNVGGLAAMRLAQEGLGEIVLVDVAPGLAQGKASDLADSRALLKQDFRVAGTTDMTAIEGSGLVIITAGLTRKPGMTREDLLSKNASIMKEVCHVVQELAAQAVVIVVANPLDLLTRVALEVTRFKPNRVMGMGITLDASRFAHLIAEEFGVSVLDIDPCVIGSHGQGMLPLPRFTHIKGVSLDEFADNARIDALVKKTVGRGQEIVTLLGSGSAYFAPSAAIAALARAVLKDEKRVLGVSAHLSGQYGLKDVCIGVPCRLGKEGVEQVVELDLSAEEKKAFLAAAESLKQQYASIN